MVEWLKIMWVVVDLNLAQINDRRVLTIPSAVNEPLINFGKV